MLTPDQKLNGLEISRKLLTRFQSDPANFLRIVTQDETGVHRFDAEKKQRKQRKHAGSQPPKTFKRVPSVGKVMASVFWDCEGVLMIE